MLRLSLALLAGLLLLPGPASSQTGLDLMQVDVLFVGAHPDDDSAVVGTFARYARDEGFRTGVVTVTGGEGGGNATGPETGRALGLIRRAEELNALAVAGVASTDFLGLEDFYFTLSAEETERRWGRGFVCDVTRLVRLRRPAAIVTMWPGPGTHGEHQMAGRAATLAFARAGDPSFCPEQIESERLVPFDPDRLYYAFLPGDAATLAVPTDAWSASAAMRYAELKSLSLMQYRSQGFDRFARVPAPEAPPEGFLLVRSRVPVEEPQRHMLAGSRLPAGASPAGVGLRAGGPYRLSVGLEGEVTLTLLNRTDSALSDARLELRAPAGWQVSRDGAVAPALLQPGESLTARFRVRPAGGAAVDRNAVLTGAYTASVAGRPIAGTVPLQRRPVAPLRVGFRPGFDVAGYRSFARETDTEWVIENLPTRVPLAVGRVSEVPLELVNESASEASGELQLTLPAGLRLAEPVAFRVAAGARESLTARIEATSAALPAGRSSARLPIEVAVPGGGRDAAEAFLLPALAIPRLPAPPVIDGDLSDLESLPRVSIGPADLWWRAAPEDAADLSADARLGWDDQYLYAGLSVRDQTVVCNIAPDDARAQLRSDAVGITLDPGGHSEDTSTTLQAAAFPCTSEAWGAVAFRDADADQGPVERTAPGLQVASRRTAAGYDIEWAIPWSALPTRPAAGDEIGLNLVLYDGDDATARVGANISQSGLAWAAFEWGGKQALPYLWGRVRLE